MRRSLLGCHADPLQADDEEDLGEGEVPNREFLAQLRAARLDRGLLPSGRNVTYLHLGVGLYHRDSSRLRNVGEFGTGTPQVGMKVVGAEGFEPPTLWSQTRCAARLRYAPTPTGLCHVRRATCDVQDVPTC